MTSLRSRFSARSLRHCMAWLGTAATVGCGSGVLVEPVSVKAAPPGRVVALVSVSDHGSAPGDLSSDNFEVREGDVALDASDIGLRVQPFGQLAGHEAVVLVDGSRPFTDAEREPLGAGLAQLVDRLRFHQAVTLLAFDGSPELRFIARYSKSQMAAPLGKDPGIERLLGYKPRDSSSSLYSAIVSGRKTLDARLAKGGPVAPLGSLVIVARGPDLAGRADEAAARAALEGQRSFLLKVGTWSKDTSLDWVGRDGTRAAASLGTLGTPVDELARLVDEEFLRRYLVSYCSPARAGKRTVEWVVKLKDEDGRTRSAQAASELDATGFNASCRPAPPQTSSL
ncbi:MAG TPA: hypothetical protein VHP33_26885 [Polyangiaceae bacterium]|nr:hypothetical protein [Polyangiaceae bacterium]